MDNLAETTDSEAPIEVVFEKLVSDAKGIPLVVLPGFPLFDCIWAWTGDPGSEHEYIDIARTTGAQVLYCHMDVFDYEDAVHQQILGPDIEFDDDDDYPPKVEEALRALHTWSEKSGEPSSIHFRFVVGGIAHDLHKYVGWLDLFLSEVEEFKVKQESEWSSQQADARHRATVEQKRKAGEIARSDRWARVKNEAQRRYATEEMFPNETRWEIDRLAELASLIYWDKVEPERERELALKADKLYEEGLSMVEVAARLGVSKDRLSRLLAIADDILGDDNPDEE